MPDTDHHTGDGNAGQHEGGYLVTSFPRAPLLGEAAFAGLTGDVVNAISPTSEADPAALLLHFLTMLGNAIGDGLYVNIDGARHTTRLHTIIVGDAALGRKGTAGGQIKALMREALPKWYKNTLLSGVRSAESIVSVVDDEQGQTNDLMLYYPEFGDLLVAMNNKKDIANVLKMAYDGDDLEVRTKNKNGWRTATHANISMIGHVTPGILTKYLSDMDIESGFANRLLYGLVQRSGSKPWPKPLDEAITEGLADRIDDIVRWGWSFALEATDPISTHLYKYFNARKFRPKREIHLSDGARSYYEDMYDRLTIRRPGTVGALSTRAPSNVIRMALIYAVAEKSSSIDVSHMASAEAVWRYCEESAAQIFDSFTGDREIDRILQQMEIAPENVLSRNDILNIFNRNLSVKRIDAIIERLLNTGDVTSYKGETGPKGGRPPTFYRLTRKRDNEETPSALTASS